MVSFEPRPDNATSPRSAAGSRRGRVESVNVSGPLRMVEHGGRLVATGIFKSPVAGRVRLRGVNLDGDDQADRTNHGGPDMAVYAYAREDLEHWGRALGREVPAASMGENLTVSGLDVSGAEIGERWRVGTAVLEVAQPRIPCFKLGIRMGDPGFVRRFARAGRPGAYLRILEAGDVGAGDEVQVIGRPGHGVTVRDVMVVYFGDHRQAGRLLAAPALAASWVRWARRVGRGPGYAGSQTPASRTRSPARSE